MKTIEEIKNSYTTWNELRPKFDALPGEAQKYIRAHSEWDYQRELEWCLRGGDWKGREFFGDIRLNFGLLKDVSGDTPLNDFDILQERDTFEGDQYPGYLVSEHYSIASKIWGNPEIAGRLPQELLDITVILDYGDNDFSCTMQDAGEKLAEYIESEISEAYRWSEYISETYRKWPLRDHYDGEEKPKETEKRYLESIGRHTEEVKRILEPENLMKTMKNLFVSSWIESSIDRTLDPSDLNYKEDLVSDALRLQEYLMGKPRETDLWSPGTPGTILKVGTHAEVEAWAIEKYRGGTEAEPKEIKEIWNNSEALVVDIQRGLSRVYTI